MLFLFKLTFIQVIKTNIHMNIFSNLYCFKNI